MEGSVDLASHTTITYAPVIRNLLFCPFFISDIGRRGGRSKEGGVVFPGARGSPLPESKHAEGWGSRAAVQTQLITEKT